MLQKVVAKEGKDWDKLKGGISVSAWGGKGGGGVSTRGGKQDRSRAGGKNGSASGHGTSAAGMPSGVMDISIKDTQFEQPVL